MDFTNTVVLFMGYPGSGKGTQGKIISKLFGIRHLSTGELFRAEVDRKTETGKLMGEYMRNGQIIPKELTFEYLSKELSSPKYRKGVIIDGYPKDLECLDFLRKTLSNLGYKISKVVYFDVPRGDVFVRLSNRSDNSRDDDTPTAINKRLDVFENETIPVSKALDRKLVDASLPIESVTEQVVKILSENSTVFHNHIDAENEELLNEIVDKIQGGDTNFQNKVYRVSDLLLGTQTKRPLFSGVYENLPNFHEIENSTEEAFTTGKMGDVINYEQIKKTLEVCFSYPGRGIMTEVEEDIYSKEIDEDGTETITLDRGNTPFEIDWVNLPGWKYKQIRDVPKFELHHSIDVSKVDATLPIDLQTLMRELSQCGFDVGGLFLFKKHDTWAYRTNEFSNASYETALSLLNSQSIVLRKIVKELLPEHFHKVRFACSLEKVHAIWKVDYKATPAVFVSGNSGKISDLNSILEHQMRSIDTPGIIEIQSDDVESVAVSKCNDAHKLLGVPVLVEDTSLKINCLDGCPGPLVKFFDPEILYKMVQNFSDSSAIAECAFAFKLDDSSEVVTFNGSTKGKIVSPRGCNGFGFDRIFIPDGCDKTYAEMTLEEKKESSFRKNPIIEFQRFMSANELNYID